MPESAPGGGVSAPGGVCSGGCLHQGVSALGCSGGGGVSAPRGFCSGGSALGVAAQWGVC